MLSSFSLEILVLACAGLLCALIILLVWQITTVRRANKLTFPAYEYVMQRTEHDSAQIINEAKKKAEAMLAEAEKSGQIVVREHAAKAEKLTAQLEKEISKQAEAMRKSLARALEDAAHSLNGSFAALESNVTAQQEQVLKEFNEANESLLQLVEKANREASKSIDGLSAKIGSAGEDIEKQLDMMRESGQSQLSGYFDSLKEAADAEVQAYEALRKKVVDDHIETIVEQIVMKVLQVQLPASEHGSLVRKALEEAKSQHLL